jgi:hypothetical protein
MSRQRLSPLRTHPCLGLTCILFASYLVAGCAGEPPSPREIEGLLASAEQVHIAIGFPPEEADYFGVRTTEFSISDAAGIKQLSENLDIETVRRHFRFGAVGTNLVIIIRISRSAQEDVSWELIGTNSLFFSWHGYRYEARISQSFFDRIIEHAKGKDL